MTSCAKRSWRANPFGFSRKWRIATARASCARRPSNWCATVKRLYRRSIVSPLLRDQLHIALSPEKVAMVRLGQGMRPKVVARHAFACDAPVHDQKPWAKALESLDAGMSKLGSGKGDAVVVLSNHFVRYALVPWSDQISDRSEELAFIRLNFSRTYGAEAQH